jgi:hypothetical protein
VEAVDLTGVSVFIDEEATRRELGYLNVRCGVTETDREDEGRKELTEESVRRVVGDVIGTEMVAVIAIGGVAVSNTGGGVIRFDSPSCSLVLTLLHHRNAAKSLYVTRAVGDETNGLF